MSREGLHPLSAVKQAKSLEDPPTQEVGQEVLAGLPLLAGLQEPHSFLDESRGSSRGSNRPVSRGSVRLASLSPETVRSPLLSPVSQAATSTRSSNRPRSRGSAVRSDASKVSRPSTAGTAASLRGMRPAELLGSFEASLQSLQGEMSQLRESQRHTHEYLNQDLNDTITWLSSRVDIPSNQKRKGRPSSGVPIGRIKGIVRATSAFVMLGAGQRFQKEAQRRDDQKQREDNERAQAKLEATEEKGKGDKMQRVLLTEGQQRVRMQKKWLELQEHVRRKRLTAAHKAYTEKAAECDMWPYHLKALRLEIAATRKTFQRALDIMTQGVSKSKSAMIQISSLGSLKAPTSAIKDKHGNVQLDGLLEVLAFYLQHLKQYTDENDLSLVRNNKHEMESLFRKHQASIRNNQAQETHVFEEVSRQRRFLAIALKPSVDERAKMKAQWAEEIDRLHVVVERKTFDKRAELAERTELLERVQDKMYEAKGELTDQNEAVARLDAELEELNQKYKDMERTQKVKKDEEKTKLRQQLTTMRVTKAMEESFFATRAERIEEVGRRTLRVQELQAQKDTMQHEADSEDIMWARFQVATLKAISFFKGQAAEDEVVRVNNEKIQVVELEKSMHAFVESLPENAEVDFEEAKAFMCIRYPKIDFDSKEYASILDEAFEKAFTGQEIDHTKTDAERLKELQHELASYGLTAAEMKGMSLEQLMQLLREEKAKNISADTEEEQDAEEGSGGEEEEDEEDEGNDDDDEEDEHKVALAGDEGETRDVKVVKVENLVRDEGEADDAEMEGGVDLGDLQPGDVGRGRRCDMDDGSSSSSSDFRLVLK